MAKIYFFKQPLIVFLFLLVLFYSCSSEYVSPDDLSDVNKVAILKSDNLPFTGCCRKYNKDNKIEFEKKYKNGKLNGIFIRYFDNGNVSNEVNFVNGNPTGYKQYFPNKKLKAEKTDDEKNQHLTTWFENGNKNLEQYLLNNILNGKSEQWFDNGQLELSCTYKNNKQEDEFSAYHKNGKKKIEGNYTNGNLDGNWKTYNEKGQIISDEKYNFGKKIGTWYYYFENGNKRAKVIYKDGLIKENKEWNESGKLINSFFAD
ncbi:MAG: hypothetical protein A2X08_00845 [Bacteroidetes bacterium GWA2_32_17]|nr:MAG: hypothetical protein A2X08_00845 [Bacteroidetes bacterium GWA2_32_17]